MTTTHLRGLAILLALPAILLGQKPVSSAVAGASAGGGIAGSDGQVQFNNSGVFGADANLHWDNVNKRLGIGTASPLTILDLVGNLRTAGRATAVLTGTIDPAASTAVVGVGTLFATELVIGDRITVSAETRTVTVITDALNLTVDTAFTDNANDTSPDVLYALATLKLSGGGLAMAVSDLGRVGLGTASPDETLDINGSLQVLGATDSKVFIKGGSSQSSTLFAVQTAAGLDSMRVLANGEPLFDVPSGLSVRFRDTTTDAMTYFPSLRILGIGSAGSIEFNTTAPPASNTNDIGIARAGANLLEINKGSTAATGELRFKLENSATQPINCTSAVYGQVYFDTGDKKLCVCIADGTDDEWVKSDDYTHATGHCTI